MSVLQIIALLPAAFLAYIFWRVGREDPTTLFWNTKKRRKYKKWMLQAVERELLPPLRRLGFECLAWPQEEREWGACKQAPWGYFQRRRGEVLDILNITLPEDTGVPAFKIEAGTVAEEGFCLLRFDNAPARHIAAKDVRWACRLDDYYSFPKYYFSIPFGHMRELSQRHYDNFVQKLARTLPAEIDAALRTGAKGAHTYCYRGHLWLLQELVQYARRPLVWLSVAGVSWRLKTSERAVLDAAKQRLDAPDKAAFATQVKRFDHVSRHHYGELGSISLLSFNNHASLPKIAKAPVDEDGCIAAFELDDGRSSLKAGVFTHAGVLHSIEFTTDPRRLDAASLKLAPAEWHGSITHAIDAEEHGWMNG